MKFEIGPGLSCDLDVLTDTRLLVQANSGGGKSWALRRLLEQSRGHVQQLIIDPEGEFSTLREKGDYVLAARQHGDTIADPRSAKLLAERLLELRVSAVLDIYELKAHERVKFVRGFLEALVDAPKKLWHPALIVVDEAHVYCPQQGEAESAGAVIDLATRGRKRGFCAVLATQRLSKLHKDAAAECNNKLIGRSTLDVDMKRAADELGMTGKEEMRVLRTLDPGEFFAFGPAFPVGVARVHVGPVFTTHPKAGARVAFDPPPPTAKVKALLPQLADLPAEAADRQRTVTQLEKDLAATRRQLTLAQRGQPIAPPKEVVKIETKVVEKPILKDGHLARIEGALTAADTAIERFHAAQRELADAVRVVRVLTAEPSPRPARVVSTPVAPRSIPRPRVAVPVDADATLGKGERAVLTAIAQTDGGVTREQLTVLTGYARSSRNTYLQRLSSAGLIDASGATIQATDGGIATLGDDFTPLPTGDELLQHWLGELGGGEREILRIVSEAYPEAVDREALSEQTGYARSSRNTYLQRLSARQLVSLDRSGGVTAAEELFT